MSNEAKDTSRNFGIGNSKPITFNSILETNIDPQTGEPNYTGSDPEIVQQFLFELVEDIGWEDASAIVDSSSFPAGILDGDIPSEKEPPKEGRGFAGWTKTLLEEAMPGGKFLADIAGFTTVTGLPMATDTIGSLKQLEAGDRAAKYTKLLEDPEWDKRGYNARFGLGKDIIKDPITGRPMADEHMDYVLSYEDESARNETAISRIFSIEDRIKRIREGKETGDIDDLLADKNRWEEVQGNSQKILEEHQDWYDTLMYDVEERRDKALSDIEGWKDFRHSWNESFSNFIEDVEVLRARKEWVENSDFNVKSLLKEPAAWVAYGIGSALPSLAIAAGSAYVGGPMLAVPVMGSMGIGSYYGGHYDEYKNEAPASIEDIEASRERFGRQLQKEYEEGYDPNKLTGNFEIDLQKLMDETYKTELVNGEEVFIRRALSDAEAHRAVRNKSLIYGVAEGVLEYLPVGRALNKMGKITGAKEVLKKVSQTAADGSKFGGKMKSPVGSATREWLGQGILEGATEMAQRATEIMVEGGFLTGDLDPKLGALDWDFQKIIDDEEFWKSGWSGLWGGLVMGGGSGMAKYNHIKTIDKDTQAQQKAKKVWEKLDRGQISRKEANDMFEEIVAESLLGSEVKKTGKTWQTTRKDFVQKGKDLVKGTNRKIIGTPLSVFAAKSSIESDLHALDKDGLTKKKVLKKWKAKYKALSEGNLSQKEFSEFAAELNKFFKNSGAHDRLIDFDPEYMAVTRPHLVNGERGQIKVSDLSEKFQKEQKIGKHAEFSMGFTIAQMKEFAEVNNIILIMNRKGKKGRWQASSKADIFSQIRKEQGKRKALEPPEEAPEIITEEEEVRETKYIKSLVSDKPQRLPHRPTGKYKLEAHIWEHQEDQDPGQKILEFIALKKTTKALDSLSKEEKVEADKLINDFLYVRLGIKEASENQLKEIKNMFAEGYFPMGLVRITETKEQKAKLHVKKGEEKRFLDLFTDNLDPKAPVEDRQQSAQDFVNLVGDDFVPDDQLQESFDLSDDEIVFVKHKILEYGEELSETVIGWKKKVLDKTGSEVKKELNALDSDGIQEIINEFADDDYELDFTRVKGALNKDGSFNWKKKDAIVGALIWNINQINRLEEGVPAGETVEGGPVTKKTPITKAVKAAKVTTKAPKLTVVGVKEGEWFDTFLRYVKTGFYQKFIKDLQNEGKTKEEINVINKEIREVHLGKLRDGNPELGNISLGDDSSTVTVENFDLLKEQEPTLKRVMVGNHGIYLEFSMPKDKGKFIKKRLQYKEYNRDGVKLYHQFKKVNYADYKPGRWYADINEYLEAAPKVTEAPTKKPGIRGAAALSKRVKKMPVSLVNNIIGLIKEAEASSMGFPERTGDIEQILSGEDIGAGWNHKDGDIDDVLIDKELNKLFPNKDVRRRVIEYIKETRVLPAAVPTPEVTPTKVGPAVTPTKTPKELEKEWAMQEAFFTQMYQQQAAMGKPKFSLETFLEREKAAWIKTQLKVTTKVTKSLADTPTTKGKKNLAALSKKAKKDPKSAVGKKSLFQIDLMDEKRLITEKKDYNKILKRLKKKMPWVKSFSDSFIIKEIKENPDAFGRAAGAMVEWTEKAGLETPPHEFFHVYWGMMKGTPIQKRAMQLLGKNAKETEEALALWVGKYYAERAVASVPKKVAIWFRQFWAKMKKAFAPNKLSAEDVKHIIASEFYKGKEIAAPAKVAEEVRYHTKGGTAIRTLVDFYEDQADIAETNTDEGKDDGIQQDRESAAENNKDIRVSLLHNEFSDMLGRHVPEKEFNLILDEAVSQSDYKEWKKYLEENHKKKRLTKKQDDKAKLTWQKMQSKVNRDNISVFDLINVDPTDGTKVLGVKRFRINQGHDPKSGKFLGKYYVKDFVREDGLVDNLHILPLNHVLKAVDKRGKHLMEARNKDSEDSREYWLFKDNISLTPIAIEQWDTDFSNQYRDDLALVEEGEMEEKDLRPLGAFFAPKGGDASTLFFISIDQATVENSMDEDFVKAYWEAEYNDGLISEDMYKEIITEWKIYRNEKSGEKLYRPLAMAQLMGRHSTWKKVKWNSYAADAKNMQDMFDRLKLDFAQGTVPYGAGPVKTLFFDPKNIILKMDDGQGNEIDVTDNLFFEDHYIGDGSIMTGGKYFQSVADVIGNDKLSVLKTVQRHRSAEGNDYINMKGLLGVVQEGLNFYIKKKDGSQGKQIVRTGWRTIDGKRMAMIEARDENGNWTEIDMIATSDERKQASGEYDVLNTIREMPENFTRILQIPSKKSKTSATFPFQWLSMFGDPALRKEVSDEMDVLEDYLGKVANIYWKRLFALRTPDKNGDYSYLYNEVYRALREGEMPGELDKYVKLLGISPALLHPSIIGRTIAQMRNRFIVDGAFSGRRLGGGTIAHFKPDMGGRVRDKNIIVSADNSTVFKEVEKRYAEYLKSQYNQRAFGRMQGEYMESSFEEQVGILNEFLENNEVKAFIHRVPVVDIYGAQMRRIQRLETGLQGDVTFMTHNDVFNVFQGDHDGDKININFVPTDVETALEKITSSKAYKEKHRVTRLNIFEHTVEEKTVMSRSNFYKMASGVASAEGSQGIMANLRSLYSNMLLRNVKLTFTYKGKESVFKVRPSNNRVVFMEGLLDNEVLTKNPELLKEIYDRGDWIVSTKETEEGVSFVRIKSQKAAMEHLKEGNKAYLETTPDHIITIWTQAAVDNAKHMLINKWGYKGRETLFPYMFEMEGHASWKIMKRGISSFLTTINTAPIKNGKTTEGRNMDTHTLFEKSEILHDFSGMSAQDQGGDLKFEYDERASERKGMPKLKKVSVNGKMTTVEKVIASLSEKKENDHNENIQHAMEWDGSPLTFDDAILWQAHAMAVRKLSESDTIKELEKVPEKSLVQGRQVGNHLAQQLVDIAIDREFFEADQNKNINKLEYDRNEELQKFIDKAYEYFHDTLTPDEQKIATLQFLAGATVSTMIKGERKIVKIRKVLQLLPIDLMHQGIVKEYLDNWGKEFTKTTEEKDNDNVPANPRDIEYPSLAFISKAKIENEQNGCT